MVTQITRPATSFLQNSESIDIVPAVPHSLDPAAFKSAPASLQTAPSVPLPPHGAPSVSRSVTKESLLEQQEVAAAPDDDDLQGLSLDATLDTYFASDPYYRITPPPSIEGRESPLLFAALFRDSAEDAASSPAIVTPQPSDTSRGALPVSENMSSQPTSINNNNSDAAVTNPALIGLPPPPANAMA